MCFPMEALIKNLNSPCLLLLQSGGIQFATTRKRAVTSPAITRYLSYLHSRRLDFEPFYHHGQRPEEIAA